jgi:antitoxin MazE
MGDVMPTKTPIRPIGNSRGVIIPAAVLNEIGAKEELLMSVEKGRIVLEAAKEPRKGWFDNSVNYRRATEEELEWENAALADTKDWQWK